MRINQVLPSSAYGGAHAAPPYALLGAPRTTTLRAGHVTSPGMPYPAAQANSTAGRLTRRAENEDRERALHAISTVGA
ncbi:hypothetical protein BER93_17215 [Xanthomonas fragariae]|nr:hypothetical protein BER92_17160 [Xanthomonas fragariae]AOD19527.1 hypothetical protein BER93_17215 [Xanthomonas fragariae]ENZ96738.1 hypothetical protein O1K_02946 [Xanthomonas fragariae LMG 25863]